MIEQVSDAIQERLEHEECAVKCSEPTAEERLAWMERDFERAGHQCREYEKQVEALSKLYAREVFYHDMDKAELRDLQRDNKKLSESLWKLDALLFGCDSKVRMNKETEETVRKLIKRI